MRNNNKSKPQKNIFRKMDGRGVVRILHFLNMKI